MEELLLFDKSKHTNIIGVDEVGRGPIAGPVSVCSVCVKNVNDSVLESIFELKNLGVTDSKKLSDKKRLKILNELKIELNNLAPGIVYKKQYKNLEYSFYISDLDQDVIDDINILQATLLGMKLSVESLLDTNTSLVLIDGNKIPNIESTAVDAVAIVKGDSKSVLIGLASVIAKSYRDNLMGEFAKIYPNYGLERHAGYPTKLHLEAVKEFGPTPIHRKTFKGVSEFYK